MATSEEPASKRMKTGEEGVPEMEVDEDTAAPITPKKERLHMSMEEMMQLYYGRLFPFKHMHRWLAYGNDSKHAQADPSYFPKREFCFTLDGDIFVRYQSFKDATDLAEAVKFKCPTKIDIGAVYNKPPQQRALYTGLNNGSDRFAPLERELVFDIDLTDYDDVRACCSEGNICPRCWPFMAAAVQVLDTALREDFSFKHILWVYSGRRGVHCWVCDERARKMTDEQRSSVAGYLSVFKGVDKNSESTKVKVATSLVMHPAVDRAHSILEQAWEQYVLPEQQLLSDESSWNQVLQYVPDHSIVETLVNKWKSGRRQKSHLDLNLLRWQDIVDEVKAKATQVRKSNKSLCAQLDRCLAEIVLAHTYPRLDVEVSKKMNHLLKAPFCIHPKTGKVCVPLDPEKVEEFNPDTVITVQQLLQELQESTATGVDAWRQTSMAECINMFESMFLNELKTSTNTALADKARAAAQVTKMDW